jgi:hypothetical protein
MVQDDNSGVLLLTHHAPPRDIVPLILSLSLPKGVDIYVRPRSVHNEPEHRNSLPTAVLVGVGGQILGACTAADRNNRETIEYGYTRGGPQSSSQHSI